MNEPSILCANSRADWNIYVAERKLAKFRAGQIAEHVFRRFQCDPDRMGNLPAELRAMLKADFLAPSSQVESCHESEDGCCKQLIRLRDAEHVEMVVIPAEKRLTFCLSTQVGCPVGCRFCASGANGFVRNLAAGEMIEELLHGVGRAGAFPDNLVFMGIGEGLLNFDNLSKTLALLSAEDGFGMSPRRITVSTSGYVPGIRKLAELGREYILAISLHAVNDDLRGELIRSMRYPLAEILEAADEYNRLAGRMVTFEYALLAGVNDSPKDGFELGRLADAHHCKVNLIPYNATGADFRRPSDRAIGRFVDAVKKTCRHVTLRVSRGGDSAAACGQLRADAEQNNSREE